MKVFAVLLVCAFVALATAARPKSDCEKHRDNAIQHETIMKLIPKCKENGDYEALQCYKDSKFCVCYTPKGHAASPISTKIKQCKCYLRRQEKIDRKHENPYIPQCNEDGSFSKKQCWDFNKSCWCVNDDNDVVGKIVDENTPLNCD